MKINITILIILVFAVCGIGQTSTDKAKLDSWRGLVLDRTTISDAKEKLSMPRKETFPASFKPIVPSKWFGDKSEKRFRKLTYKNIEGFDEANLYFLDDYLVVIELDLMEDLPAASLINTYENKFFPLVGNYIAMTPSDLEEANRQIIYPDDGFPLQYYLASANSKAIGLAFASIGTKQRLKYLGAETIPATTLSGNVRKLQLVSRKLEIKKEVNLLR